MTKKPTGLLSKYGVDMADAGTPWYQPRDGDRLRIVNVDPKRFKKTLPGLAGEVTVYCRLDIQKDVKGEPLLFVWEVTSKRALSALDQAPDGAWFVLRVFGKGTDVQYRVDADKDAKK